MPGDSLVPPEVDFDRLLASLKDLSELAVDSDTQQSPMPSRVPHGVLEPIPLELYRNGIVMFDGPFRPFHDPSTQVGVTGWGETGLCTLRPLWWPTPCSPLVGDDGPSSPPAPRLMQNLQNRPPRPNHVLGLCFQSLIQRVTGPMIPGPRACHLDRKQRVGHCTGPARPHPTSPPAALPPRHIGWLLPVRAPAAVP